MSRASSEGWPGCSRPVRYLTWLLIPLVFIAVLTLFHRIDDFAYDVNTAWGHLAIVPRLLAGLFIVGLACNLTQGAVATAFGARIRDIKIAFIFGFIPRFTLDLSPVAELPRRGRVWTHGTPLLVRLAVFSICTIVWASYRASGTWLPDFALLLAELALLEFFIDAMPFFPNARLFLDFELSWKPDVWGDGIQIRRDEADRSSYS